MKLIPLAAIATAAYYGYRYWRRERPGARVAAVRLSDEELTSQVASRLKDAGAVPADLRMHVRDGTLHLSGRVSAAERDLILRHGLAVEGIRSVENKLEVQETGVRQPSDTVARSR
jgi:osmotically-inducible protein OsmY